MMAGDIVLGIDSLICLAMLRSPDPGQKHPSAEGDEIAA